MDFPKWHLRKSRNSVREGQLGGVRVSPVGQAETLVPCELQDDARMNAALLQMADERAAKCRDADRSAQFINERNSRCVHVIELVPHLEKTFIDRLLAMSQQRYEPL